MSADLPGQPEPGEERPGQPRPGQPRPGQARPGQPRPGQARPGQARPRPQDGTPTAQRNNERRRRRAARAAARREERRRKERDRRRVEREQRGEVAPPRSQPQAPVVAPRPSRPEPPDPPGLAGLRSAAPREPVDAGDSVGVGAAATAHGPAEVGKPLSTHPAEEPTVIRKSGRRAEPVAARGARRRAEVRMVDPWSVFRLSLILYLCLLVVVTIGTVLFWLVLSRVPLLRDMLDQIERLGIPVDPGLVLSVLLPVGLLNVLLWSGVNLFFAVLYNAVADMFGGLRVTLSDEEHV